MPDDCYTEECIGNMCLTCSRKYRNQIGTSHVKSSINEKFETHKLSINENSQDVISYFDHNKEYIRNELNKRMLNVNGALKWYLDIHIEMKKLNIDNDEITTDPYFRSK